MKIFPMVRNNICLNSHPVGCEKEVDGEIVLVQTLNRALASRSSPDIDRPKNVLIVGCSTGYGLASRVVAAFGYGASTVGFSFEKEPGTMKTGSPGWYANKEFDAMAAKSGLIARSFNMDAFSAAAKSIAVETARELNIRYDLVIYSLASPVRLDPETGTLYRSVIKPIGRPYTGKTVDVFTGKMSEAVVQPADENEVAETIKVMGGEDWELWIQALRSAGVLADKAITAAYSYIGPSLSWPIYRDGTIGKAKEHLEATARRLNERYGAMGLRAFISVNKALVTRASAVIPVIPLYVSTLFKVMKERNIHEGCVEQIVRLFSENLYPSSGGAATLDVEGRIRLDDLEMGSSVQEEVQSRMAKINERNVHELADIDGFKEDFLRAHGFAVPGVDYDAEVDPLR